MGDLRRIERTTGADRAAARMLSARGSVRAAFNSLELRDDDGEPLSFDDLVEWAFPGARAILAALDRGDVDAAVGRLVGSIAAGIIVGVELDRTWE